MIETILAFLPFSCFGVFMLSIPLVFGVGLFFILRVGRQRIVALHGAWQVFAQREGLTFDKGSTFIFPNIAGQYRRRPVTVGIFTILRTRRRANTYYTRASTPIKLPPGALVQASDRAQTGSFYRTISAPEIAAGSTDFAMKFIVRGTAPELAPALLTERVQRAMLDNGFSHLTLADDLLTVRVHGFESRTPTLAAMVDLVTEAAEALEASGLAVSGAARSTPC